MKKYIISIFQLIFLAVLLPTVLIAQSQDLATVTSMVVDQEGAPIAGASVYYQFGNNFEITNAAGEFTIVAPKLDVVRIEVNGYETRQMAINVIQNAENITMVKSPFQMSENDMVNVPFGKFNKRRITGSVGVINQQEIEKYDNKEMAMESLKGRVPGLFGENDIRGLDGVIVVVDGIPRSTVSLSMSEIEQITVLKDVTSRILYGTQANKGVIMVTTKKGTPNKRLLNVTIEEGISTPAALPKYLNSAEYMDLYNEALENDGKDNFYSQEQINNTRNGISPLENRNSFADEDYYSSEYLNSFTNYTRFIAEASGGSDKAQYYANIGYDRSNSLEKIGQGDKANNNTVRARSNVNYQLSDYIKLNLTGIAHLNFNVGPNYSDFAGTESDNDTLRGYWAVAAKIRPTEYPLLIDKKYITDESILGSTALVGNQFILGGNSNYQKNLYGDLYFKGEKSTTSMMVQFNTGIDLDLKFIAEGLTAKGYLTFDFLNTIDVLQDRMYKVYEPVWDTNMAGNDSLWFQQHGEQNFNGQQGVGDRSFVRSLGYFGTLNYDNTFGKHAISATALAYTDRKFVQDVFIQSSNLTFGGRVNYMFDNKYIVEGSAAIVGSSYLPEENRYGVSPSVGAAWVISEETFLKDNGLINYLKLRGNVGSIKTDQTVTEYNLYKTTYERLWVFNYDDESSKNRIVRVNQIGNPDINYVTRNEFSVGFDAFLANMLWVEAGFFSSKLNDDLAQLNSKYPSFVGVKKNDYSQIPYENYNNYEDKGFEAGLTLDKSFGELKIRLGYNFVYSQPTAVKLSEPIYAPENAHRQKEGKASDIIMGYKFDRFYVESDFDANGDLLESLPKTYLGTVRPGDLKYVDVNKDGNIDENDQTEIGNNSARLQHGINLNIAYKGFELFALGTGQSGQNTIYQNEYYWVFGDRKYSEEVLGRWTAGSGQNATYPALSATASPNNFKRSDFWMYDNDWFTIHTVQLSYSLPFKTIPYVKGMKFYARAHNLLTISDIQEKRELNVGMAPQMRTYAFGIKASF